MKFELNRDELMDLALQIYEEASHGYIDLKDSACDRILTNFLINKKSIRTNTNLFVSSTSEVATGMLPREVYSINGSSDPNGTVYFTGTDL
jgi:hypothetical protein